ncbi:MAG: type II secretion system F family protein, partial [Candidatus Eremiobacteraeota bacterium]|nr:type II secretion system F family protein [Candidatus Eremiobacteraeota bacterium]
MRTWPGRFRDWLVDCFWAFVAWVKDLPRRIKEGFLAVCAALRDLIVNGYLILMAFLFRMAAPIVSFFQTRLDPDPATIPPKRLAISQRGRKISIFTRQLASMIQGGVPLLQSLDVLSEQAEDHKLGYVSGQLSRKLAQGFSFSRAVSEYPRIFPPVFAYLLQAGENTGRMVNVVSRLADLFEKEDSLVKQVRGALSYPLFVMGLTFVLTLGLFSTVLPGFADFYDDFDVPLPVITGTLMTITSWVQTPWFWLLLGLSLAGLYLFIKRSWAVPERRLIMFQILLWVPMVGPIVKQTCLARFCWAMELTQEAGLDIVRSLRLSSLASGSAILDADYPRISKGITEGELLSELMKYRPDVYPHLLHQMCMMGEETSHVTEA